MNARATRFPHFDSLRAIGALAIFGTHAYFTLRNNAPGPLRPYAARLEVGVYIFFVISGFLLYRPFARARLSGVPGPSIGAYAWRRLLRIGPAYWVALTIIALWIGERYVFELRNAVWLYPFAQSYRPGLAVGGLSQAWSLSVEAAFYVMLPVYALALRALPLSSGAARLRAELAGVAGLAIAGFAFTTFASAKGYTSAGLERIPLHLTLPCYLQVFAGGMGLAVVSVWYQEREPTGWIRGLDRFPGVAWGVALLAFWVVSTQLGLDGRAEERPGTGVWVIRSALYALIGLAVVIPAVFGDQTRGLVRRLLANRVLMWIGLVSYSLFLYHLAVLFEVDGWDIPAKWPVSLGLALAVAAVSYYCVERPAMTLKRWVPKTPEPFADEATEEQAPPAPARV